MSNIKQKSLAATPKKRLRCTCGWPGFHHRKYCKNRCKKCNELAKELGME